MKSLVREQGNTPDFFNVNSYETTVDNQAAEKVAERVKREVSGASVTSGERTGKAFLRIYVRTRAQAAEVQKIANASPVPVFTEIISLEEIEKSAEMMAGMKGFALDVTFAKDGTAYWAGYLPDAEDWKGVKDQMEKDLPFIKENINNLTFAPDIEKRANELLDDAGIRAQLAFQALPREMIISGTMPENQAELWSEAFAKLRDQFAGLLTFTDRVASGKPVLVSDNPFHSPIAGVTLGAIPSVVLVDGQRIYKGAVVKDGSVLASITETSLTFKGAKGAFSIPIQTNALNENASAK
jgi:type III secretion system YscD/HrpQ family protein